MEGSGGTDSTMEPDGNEVIERAAYAAVGHVDCRPKNAAKAARVIREFVTGQLDHAGYEIVRKRAPR